MRELPLRTPLAMARILPCWAVVEDDDPIGFARSVGAQHNGLVAQFAH
jgi:hypothetical protein